MEYAKANTQGLVSHHFFPLKLQPSSRYSSLPGQRSLLWFLGVQQGAGSRLQLGTPGSGVDGIPVEHVREMGYCVLCALGILFPARENQTTLFRGHSLRTPCLSVDSRPVSPSGELKHTQVLAVGSQAKSGRLEEQSWHSFSSL